MGDSSDDVWLTIATTRPETIPGDTAVAVNPKDPRYAHLIGKHIVRPLPAELPREQKLIPIIGDEHVDFEFGTGVLKVTPAHDKADFEIGQRHKLPIVDIMNPNGTMNDLAGDGLERAGPFRGAQGGGGKAEGTRRARGGKALREQRRLQPARRCADRTAPERAMVFEVSRAWSNPRRAWSRKSGARSICSARIDDAGLARAMLARSDQNALPSAALGEGV